MAEGSSRRSLLGLAGWLVVCLAAGGTGALASADAAQFYGELTQPPWSPPAWLFGPVWTVLYLMMGCAAWLVWRRHGFGGARFALRLFIVQLVANTLWTWLFFKLHLGAGSMVEIVLLWLLIVGTIAAFWPLRRLAALLLLPYLAWVSFASALTWSLWRLNPAVLT